MGRVMGLEPMIFWATTRRVNPYTTPAIVRTHKGPRQNSTIVARRGQDLVAHPAQSALKRWTTNQNEQPHLPRGSRLL